MKLALRSNVSPFIREFIEQSLDFSLLFEAGPGGETLIVLGGDCESFEKGRPAVEKLRGLIQGLVPGPLDIYVQVNEMEPFISLVDYTVRCERGWSIWREGAMEEFQRGDGL